MSEHDDLYNSTVLDANGSRIGGVAQVYLDDATGEPTFVTARTGLFGNKEVCVPLTGAIYADGLIQVPQHAEVIKQAPGPQADRRLGPAQEAEIYRHYAMSFVDPDTVGATDVAGAEAAAPAAEPDSAPLAPAEAAAAPGQPAAAPPASPAPQTQQPPQFTQPGSAPAAPAQPAASPAQQPPQFTQPGGAQQPAQFTQPGAAASGAPAPQTGQPTPVGEQAVTEPVQPSSDQPPQQT